MPYTLHTYASVKGELETARRWLRKRGILSQIETIKSGHHRFITHWPGNTADSVSHKIVNDAFAHAGIAFNEAWERTDDDPTTEAIGLVVEQRDAKEPSLNDKLLTVQKWRNAFHTLHYDSRLSFSDRKRFENCELDLSMQGILALAELMK